MATAFGKLILFGEHAVVHGQPSIAIPLRAVQVSTSITPRPQGDGLWITSKQLEHPLSLSDTQLPDALRYPIELALRHFNITQQPNIEVTISSTIPMASGFGSGAALAKALIDTIADALHQTIDPDALNQLVYEVEKIHHGTPSGIDNTVIVYEHPIYFVKDQPIEPINISTPMTLLVATLPHATSTYITVGDVNRLYENEPEHISIVFHSIGDIVRTARQALQNGDPLLLGKLMLDNHHYLQTLTVSDEQLDQLCYEAINAGALGAKLSGGGRGGNMIALVTDSTKANVKAALLANGAATVIETQIG